MKKLASIILGSLLLISCGDDDKENNGDNNNESTGTVTLKFDNQVEEKSILLESENYTNKSNEIYTITELKYIISNIILIKENGEEYKYPSDKGYFLINEEEANSKTISLTEIPEGNYTKIKFGVGVDQSKYPLNGMANFIPTAEENNMLWSWSAGYIFTKFEGTYTSEGATKDFKLHIGSHGTTLDNYREVELSLSSQLVVVESETATKSIIADVSKIMDGTSNHSLEEKNDIQVDPDNAPKIADNIITMFNSED